MDKNSNSNVAAAICGAKIQAATKEYWNSLSKGQKIIEVLSVIYMLVSYLIGAMVLYYWFFELFLAAKVKIINLFHHGEDDDFDVEVPNETSTERDY